MTENIRNTPSSKNPPDSNADTMGGWVENLDEADDGYLKPGETIDGEAVRVDRDRDQTGSDNAANAGASVAGRPSGRAHADTEDPEDSEQPGLNDAPGSHPPGLYPGDSTYSRTSSSGKGSMLMSKLKTYWWYILIVIVAIVVFLYLRHSRVDSSPFNPTPQAAAGRHHRVPLNSKLHSKAEKTGSVSQASPAGMPASLSPAKTHDTAALSGISVPPMEPSTGDMGAANGLHEGPHQGMDQGLEHASAPNPLIQDRLDGLKSQLSTLETQMAQLRSSASSDSLGKQIKALNHDVAIVTQRLAASSRNSSVSNTAKVLHGYRLLAVVGQKAVIEEIATGRTGVLSANQHLGQMTVYQVSNGQVVTNYGVF